MLAASTFDNDGGWSDVADPSTISDRIAEPGTLLWAYANIGALSPSDIETIAGEFGLHALAVEDAIHTRQRPKLEAYDNHLFAVMHQLDEQDGQLEATQLASFIGATWILTLHDGAERSIETTRSRCRVATKSPDQGPSFIMHALLDTIVDDYEIKATQAEAELEELEDLALRDQRARLESQLYSLKQRLSRLRRYTVPGERLLAQINDPGRFGGLIADRTAEQFRDVHDHLLRIIDLERNVEELVDALIDLQRAHQANALNQVTKLLTGWAAIIAVPTFIASVYGMNFELLPDEGSMTGFVFALGLMAASGAVLYRTFKRRGWI